MIKKIFLIISIILVVLLAFSLRKKLYAQIPIPGQSTDEYSYSWVGLSLIQTGMPVGISGFPGYQNIERKYMNVDHYMEVIPSDPLEINYPWMDHPPLLGLITGGYAYLSGARNFSETTSLLIRRPIIIIGTLSVLLAMIFCWINFGYLTGLIAGLIYATAPLVVLSSRMIQAENAIIPCILGCMISLSLFLKNKGDKWLFITGLIAGVATLFKLTGFTTYLLVAFVLLYRHKKINKKFMKDFGFFLAVSLPISFLFVVYGLAYGWENFKTILFSNYNRFYGIGPNLLLELIRNQRLTQHKFLPEVWVISGWLVFIGSLIKRPKEIGDKLLMAAMMAYLIIYIFFGSQPYGWYTFPFWPLLIMILARFFAKNIESGKKIIPVFLLSILILGANIDRLMNVFEFQKFASWWRFGVSGLILLAVVLAILKINSKLIQRIIFVILFGLMIYTNLKYLNMIDINFWWNNIS
jgi:4-amino-4-deoxy-L-arabinose transferase-like glycosyltransferase